MMTEHLTEQAECVEDVAWQTNCTPVPYGQCNPQLGLAGCPIDEVEAQRRQREYTIMNAVQVLQQARQIRADAALMVDVRAYIRKLRDDGAALLDELG